MGKHRNTYGNPGAIDQDERQTPKALFDFLHSHFEFTLDAAATSHNALCPTYYTKQDESLIQSWANHVVWCNPPFTKKLAFVQKALTSALFYKSTVVMLLPSSTGARWFCDYVLHANEIWFIKGRLKFAPMNNPAPFDCCLAIYLPHEVSLMPRIKVLEQRPEYRLIDTFNKRRNTYGCI